MVSKTERWESGFFLSRGLRVYYDDGNRGINYLREVNYRNVDVGKLYFEGVENVIFRNEEQLLILFAKCVLEQRLNLSKRIECRCKMLGVKKIR